MTMDGLVTTAEALRRTGITGPTLRKRIRRGDIAVYRDPLDDRLRLISVSDLDALLSPRPIEKHGSKGAAASGVAA